MSTSRTPPSTRRPLPYAHMPVTTGKQEMPKMTPGRPQTTALEREPALVAPSPRPHVPLHVRAPALTLIPPAHRRSYRKGTDPNPFYSLLRPPFPFDSPRTLSRVCRLGKSRSLPRCTCCSSRRATSPWRATVSSSRPRPPPQAPESILAPCLTHVRVLLRLLLRRLLSLLALPPYRPPPPLLPLAAFVSHARIVLLTLHGCTCVLMSRCWWHRWWRR